MPCLKPVFQQETGGNVPICVCIYMYIQGEKLEAKGNT